MTDSNRAWITLKNDQILENHSIGAAGERRDDLIFNTTITKYHKILTNPSYANQIILITYPLINNYNITKKNTENKHT